MSFSMHVCMPFEGLWQSRCRLLFVRQSGVFGRPCKRCATGVTCPLVSRVACIVGPLFDDTGAVSGAVRAVMGSPPARPSVCSPSVVDYISSGLSLHAVFSRSVYFILMPLHCLRQPAVAVTLRTPQIQCVVLGMLCSQLAGLSARVQ
jgi:hypothetical protein